MDVSEPRVFTLFQNFNASDGTKSFHVGRAQRNGTHALIIEEQAGPPRWGLTFGEAGNGSFLSAIQGPWAMGSARLTFLEELARGALDS